MKNEFDGNWLSTQMVKKFHFLNPHPKEIFIEDIAHALSMQCRFGGHGDRFYSVAEHSVRMVGAMSRDGATDDYLLAALLHDAEEAYLPDIPRPVKYALGQVVEDIYLPLRQVILAKFGVSDKIDWSIIKDYDNRMCLTEAKALGLYNKDWMPLGKLLALGTENFGWSPSQAKTMFLVTFEEAKERGSIRA